MPFQTSFSPICLEEVWDVALEFFIIYSRCLVDSKKRMAIFSAKVRLQFKPVHIIMIALKCGHMIVSVEILGDVDVWPPVKAALFTICLIPIGNCLRNRNSKL